VYLTKSRVLEEPAGKCRFASVEGFVSQKGQFKSYSEFNRKTDVVGLMSMFIVGHTTLCELRSFGYVAAFWLLGQRDPQKANLHNQGK